MYIFCIISRVRTGTGHHLRFSLPAHLRVFVAPWACGLDGPQIFRKRPGFCVKTFCESHKKKTTSHSHTVFVLPLSPKKSFKALKLSKQNSPKLPNTEATEAKPKPPIWNSLELQNHPIFSQPSQRVKKNIQTSTKMLQIQTKILTTRCLKIWEGRKKRSVLPHTSMQSLHLQCGLALKAPQTPSPATPSRESQVWQLGEPTVNWIFFNHLQQLNIHIHMFPGVTYMLYVLVFPTLPKKVWVPLGYHFLISISSSIAWMVS